MPYRAPRICKRCKKATDIPGPRCSICKEKENNCKAIKETEYQSERLSPRERGYGTTWRKISIMYRKKHPLCECNQLTGEVLPCGRYSKVVHHLDGDTGNNDPSNHLAMASGCHSRYESKINRWSKTDDAKRISNKRKRDRRDSNRSDREITIGKFLGV